MINKNDEKTKEVLAMLRKGYRKYNYIMQKMDCNYKPVTFMQYVMGIAKFEFY